jgi:hypothetical protein
MAGYLLHQGAVISCMHSGQATPTRPTARVKVGGRTIVTRNIPYTVASCDLCGTSPCCATATWTTAAQRVKAGGQPVLLSDSQASCSPTGTGLIITTTQRRVRGI